jgi:uncharacterized protein (TIGR03086 family)
MDIVVALDRAFDHANRVIGNITADQYGQPTPCTEWTVRDLLEHLIGAVESIGAAASGTLGPEPHDGPSDPAARFQRAATRTMAAWRAPGVFERVVEIPAGQMPATMLADINLIDTATHTWDLAVATGQDPALPDDVATAALDASLTTVSPALREGRFDPEIPAPGGAGPTERLVAYLGRKP